MTGGSRIDRRAVLLGTAATAFSIGRARAAADRRGVGRARNVTRGEDAWDAGFEVLVHRHATICLNSGAFGKIDQRFDADPDHDQVGVNGVAILERHAVAFVQAVQIFAHLWPEHRGHGNLFRRDDVNLELSLN